MYCSTNYYSQLFHSETAAQLELVYVPIYTDCMNLFSDVLVALWILLQYYNYVVFARGDTAANYTSHLEQHYSNRDSPAKGLWVEGEGKSDESTLQREDDGMQIPQHKRGLIRYYPMDSIDKRHQFNEEKAERVPNHW